MVVKGKEKVTWMKVKTGPLDCDKTFKKVKKALSSIPQIKDQAFDEKSNTVTIKVVCCSPDKIMDKLCSKGRGAIKLIETIDPSKETEKSKESEKPTNSVPFGMYYGHDYYWSQHNGCYERPIYDSYGGGSSSQPNGCYERPIYDSYGDGSSFQPNGCYERPIYDSYGGGPPPSSSGVKSEYSSEEGFGCSIM